MSTHSTDRLTRKEIGLYFSPDHCLDKWVHHILLSSYSSDHDFYVQQCSKWKRRDSEHGEWIKTPSFGNWRELAESMAVQTRRLREDREYREVLLRLFGTPPPDFLDMITAKQLFQALKTANDYRNSWKGHGGIYGERERQSQLQQLNLVLQEIRNLFQDKWQTAQLVMPGSSVFRKGIFETQAELLIGVSLPFRQVKVHTLAPMEAENIYLLHEGQQYPVKLLSFMRLMESPRTQLHAFYFYNRVNSDGVRWVSYHFESESEVVRTDQYMEPLFGLQYMEPLFGLLRTPLRE